MTEATYREFWQARAGTNDGLGIFLSVVSNRLREKVPPTEEAFQVSRDLPLSYVLSELPRMRLSKKAKAALTEAMSAYLNREPCAHCGGTGWVARHVG